MTNERKEFLKKKIRIAFEGINVLSLEMRCEDYEWANKLLNSGDDVNEDDEAFAMCIVNLADDLRDLSNEFLSE